MSSSSPLTPDSGSELSELSGGESAELEKKLFRNKSKGGLDAWLQGGDGASSPPPKRKREPSPPHDYILADNPDIAFIVMFRARFGAAFPRFVGNFGPQDLENAVVGSPPGDLAEKLLCALLGLTLNRKKDIAVGSYNKALEEAISVNKHQWPRSWVKNPMTGGTTYHNMTPEQRLDFLNAVCMWALNTSEDIQTIIKDSYKQNRHDDDLNQPLSVQSWGRDGDKRRYWLIEGQDDTYFRLYRESNPALKTSTWWNVAGTIEEIRAFSAKLQEEGTQAAKRLSERINGAIPRFEAGEDKRKRREYRVNRKMQFKRPEPGFSLYDGRTRGKRLKYTFSDDEDGTSDAYSGRRSTRNATPAEAAGPTITSSGRQVRSRLGGMYGETLHAGQEGQAETPGLDTDGYVSNGRTRSGRGPSARPRKSTGYESDEESDAVSSGNDWEGNDEEEDVDEESENDVDMDGDDELDGELPKHLIVTLAIPQRKLADFPSSDNKSAHEEAARKLPILNGSPVKTEQNGVNGSVGVSATASKALPEDSSSAKAGSGSALTHSSLTNGYLPSLTSTQPSSNGTAAAPALFGATQSAVAASGPSSAKPVADVGANSQAESSAINGDIKPAPPTAAASSS